MRERTRDAHRAAQVTEVGEPVRVLPTVAVAPGPHEVRIDVAAAGICGADIGSVRNPRPDSGFPITPGHEVAGVIAERGSDVTGFDIGERVAVGWFGGSCGYCTACRTGDVVHCPRRRVPGLSYPGGWSTTVTVPAIALARIPDQLSMAEAAPFGCAGVTTFNAVRNAGVRPGGRVAVVGIGGLGHLAVQFASAMGYETIAIGRGPDKAALAWELGADHYIAARAEAPGAALNALGGAELVISTATGTDLLGELLDGLAPHGQLTVIGLDGKPLELRLDKLVMHARSINGHLTGSPSDTEQAMRFAVTTGVRARVQTVPLDAAAEALAEQQAGRARFRMVLTTR
ncbi:alcohol dehydrogenase [Pseudonocardia eucalypti]|uniref:alcohol dehydrogenase n=1 Tax=Pseudonocardia eucalypti TaxID=648755 RepID=A0ABP9QHI8_9PSEU|nr:alcohol dehydrogenase [Pseudonocardia eucalypti]